jgi:hypothetical protein
VTGATGAIPPAPVRPISLQLTGLPSPGDRRRSAADNRGVKHGVGDDNHTPMTREPLAELPFWPRFLSRYEAARYLGVSVDVFSDEVAAGVWPKGSRRGTRGGRVTWDRLLLDLAADRYSGLTMAGSHVPQKPTLSDGDAERWETRLNATIANKRTKGG